MKNTIASFFILFSICSFSQTQLITNGSFENTTSWATGWTSVSGGSNLWGGSITSCTAQDGIKYIWWGDQNQATGLNNVNTDLYQTFTIPANTSVCSLQFYVKISTKENLGVAYDYLYVRLRNSSGALLSTLYSISNLQGTYGIPGCPAWLVGNYSIPSTFFGQTVRLSFEATTDNADATIFRVDNVSVLATASCVYSLSQSNFACPGTLANNYTNITTVTTPPGCAWIAAVTAGASWLSTVSSGNGNGSVSITVTQNTSGGIRIGTINIEGQTLTIVQPANTGIGDLTSENYYSVYPNPAGNILNIEGITTLSTITITDVSGKVVNIIETDNNTVINTGSLAKGIYSLKISNQQMNKTQKLIIQ